MGAFLGALGGALAKGALAAGKNVGQAAKNNLKQLGPQSPDKQKQQGEARNQQPPSKQRPWAHADALPNSLIPYKILWARKK